MANERALHEVAVHDFATLLFAAKLSAANADCNIPRPSFPTKPQHQHVVTQSRVTVTLQICCSDLPSTVNKPGACSIVEGKMFLGLF